MRNTKHCFPFTTIGFVWRPHEASTSSRPLGRPREDSQKRSHPSQTDAISILRPGLNDFPAHSIDSILVLFLAINCNHGPGAGRQSFLSSFFVLFGKGLRWAQALIDRLVWVKFLISIHVIHVCICHSHIFFQLKNLVFRSKFLISFSFNISSSFSKTMVSIPSRMVSGPCSTHPNDCTHWKLDPTTPFSTLCCSHFAPSKDFESHLICWKRRVLL